MKEHIKKTMRSEVLTNIGGFSGAFSMNAFKNIPLVGISAVFPSWLAAFCSWQFTRFSLWKTFPPVLLFLKLFASLRSMMATIPVPLSTAFWALTQEALMHNSNIEGSISLKCFLAAKYALSYDIDGKKSFKSRLHT